MPGPFRDDLRFPDRISFGAVGGANFDTDVVFTDGKLEYRNQNWEQSQLRWDVAHAARMPPEAEALKAFFMIAIGRFYGFRFKDWTDYRVPDHNGTGVFASAGTGSPSTQFQLYKRYTYGAQFKDRIINKPVSGTIVVTGGTGWTIDYTTGLLSGGTGTPLSWVGEFDVPCRFDTDAMRAEVLNRNVQEGLIIGWSAIPIVEIPIEEEEE